MMSRRSPALSKLGYGLFWLEFEAAYRALDDRHLGD